MNHTKGSITVFYCIHNNPDCEQVIDLIQCLVLIHHFLIDTEEMFHSSIYLCLDPCLVNMLFHMIYNTLNKLLTFCFTQCNLFHQIIIDIRLQIFQRQVIQFYLDLGNTKTLRNRCIDVHGLSGFFLLLFRAHILQRTHIMQTVRQLDNNDTDIFRHSQKHFS